MDIEALYELMFDNVQDAIFLVDVDHTGDQPTFTYRRINHSYEEKTGIPNEEMAGNTPREQFDAEMAEELNDNYRRCVEEGQTLRYVEQLDLPNGSGTWKTRLTPLVKEDRVEAILGVTRDITEDMNRRRDLIFFREAMTSLWHACSVSLIAAGKRSSSALSNRPRIRSSLRSSSSRTAFSSFDESAALRSANRRSAKPEALPISFGCPPSSYISLRSSAAVCSRSIERS